MSPLVKIRTAAVGSLVLIASLALLGSAAGSNQARMQSLTRQSLKKQSLTMQSLLPLMPLPAASLGPDAKKLPLDRDSGVVSNALSASRASGNVSSSDLGRLGQVTAYGLEYNDRSLAAIQAGHGLISVESEVKLFRDTTSATRGFAFWRKDDANVGRFRDTGISLKVTGFPTTDLGDASYGYQATVFVRGKKPYYGIDIWFRAGRLLASVGVSAADRGKALPLALELADKLQTRMQGVIAGTVSGRPVRLPDKAKPGPPPGGPSPQALTLTTQDLGSGKVEKQGYQLDSDFEPVSEYERVFGQVGQFADVDETVALFRSNTEASFELAYVGSAFASSKFLNRVAQGGEPKNAPKISYTVKSVKGIKAGDELLVSRATAKLAGGRTIGQAFLVMRVGRTFEIIVVTTPVGAQLVPTALAELAKSAAARVSKGLHQ